MSTLDIQEADLERIGWLNRVGAGRGIYISVPRQRLWIIENGRAIRPDPDHAANPQANPHPGYPCSTAANGIGSLEGSYMTPPGWHTIDEKHGDGLPLGAVLKSRRPTGQIWQPGQHTPEDLVLTRILWLTGLEPGVNQGLDSAGRVIDSKRRYIYIHGTNDEARLGTPASHGCIRLSNAAAIEVFDAVEVGVLVVIDPGRG